MLNMKEWYPALCLLSQVSGYIQWRVRTEQTSSAANFKTAVNGASSGTLNLQVPCNLSIAASLCLAA